jgi:long-chain-fatty-acid--CoA ligase ACSBG
LTENLLLFVKSVPEPETQEPTDMLDATAIEWFRSHGVEVSTVSDVCQRNDPAISRLITDGISRANQRAVSHAQTVQKFIILPRDFSIDGGELGRFLPHYINLM